MRKKKIGIIGCGNMGEALVRCLSNRLQKAASVIVSEADGGRRDYIHAKYKVDVETDNEIIVERADIIIIAVKPKDIDRLLKDEIRPAISDGKLLVSIAAGITIKRIENLVGKDIAVIRVMPNMAAAIGEAISAMSVGRAAKAGDARIVKDIFSAIGDVVEVDEKLMDAVTALSGSGPAYFFYLMEAMIEAGERLGLDREKAKLLVSKTAMGSMILFEALKEEPAALIKKVASKGGTTEAALKVFEAKGLKRIIKDAVDSAARRSKELSRHAITTSKHADVS